MWCRYVHGMSGRKAHTYKVRTNLTSHFKQMSRRGWVRKGKHLEAMVIHTAMKMNIKDDLPTVEAYTTPTNEYEDLSDIELEIEAIQLEMKLMDIQKIKKSRQLECLRSSLENSHNEYWQKQGEVGKDIGLRYSIRNGDGPIRIGDLAELITKSKSGHFQGVKTVEVIGNSELGGGGNVAVRDPKHPNQTTYRSPLNLKKKQNRSVSNTDDSNTRAYH